MKAKTMITVTSLLIAAGVVFAADPGQEHQAHHPGAAAAPATGAPATPGGGMPMMAMQEQMQKMRAQMEEIRRTGDPDKRDVLSDEHMAEMQKMLRLMQGMHGGAATMGPGGMMPGSTTADMMKMMKRQQMMEQRMDMMQMMMDQMWQNQAASEETCRIRQRHTSAS